MLALATLLVASSLSSVVAEEATPAGVSFESLAVASVEVLPPTPAAIVLQRYRLEPGASQSVGASDPSFALIYGESGTGTIRLEASVLVRRAGEATATLAEPEEVPANTDFAIEPGDSFPWPPNVAGVVRNDGAEPVTALVVLVSPQEDAAAAS
jgi:quercetin dioxygenase-like cupin family protein